jgi:cell division protein FtsQ
MKRPEGFDPRAKATAARPTRTSHPKTETTRGAAKPPRTGSTPTVPAVKATPKTQPGAAAPPKATAPRPQPAKHQKAATEAGQRAAAPARDHLKRRPVGPRPQKSPTSSTTTAPTTQPTRLPRLFADRPRSPQAEARRAARERRKFERGEIRRFTRRSRNRRIAWLAAGVLVLGMLGGVTAAVFSPLFSLQRIDIRGSDRVSEEELLQAVDGQLGTPLALLDEGRIRNELAEFPLIRSFITELVPPDTLVIRVTERKPVGALPADGGFVLTDPAGVVVQSVQERPDGMPLIDVGDQKVPSTAFRSAAEVLLALPADLAARVDTVSARTKDDVTLVLTGSDQRVLWGSAEDSVLKAQVLAALVAQQGENGPGQYDVSAPLTAVFRLD